MEDSASKSLGLSHVATIYPPERSPKRSLTSNETPAPRAQQKETKASDKGFLAFQQHSHCSIYFSKHQLLAMVRQCRRATPRPICTFTMITRKYIKWHPKCFQMDFFDPKQTQQKFASSTRHRQELETKNKIFDMWVCHRCGTSNNSGSVCHRCRHRPCNSCHSINGFKCIRNFLKELFA